MSQEGSYLFDPSAFWTDEDVEWMTYQQVGMFKRLMWHQWQNGSIPEDPAKLARLLCRGPEVFNGDSIAPLLPPLLAPFDPIPGEPGRMRQKRLHATREEWRRVQDRNRESGRKGAEKRWGKRNSNADSPAIAPLDAPPNGGVRSKGREGKGREGKEDPEENPQKDSHDRQAGHDANDSGVPALGLPPSESLPEGANCRQGRGANPESEESDGREAQRTPVRDLEGVGEPDSDLTEGGERHRGRKQEPDTSAQGHRGAGAPDRHTAPAKESDAVGRKPNRAQEVRGLLSELVDLGLDDASTLWADRMEQTSHGKRPNSARQAAQLRKLIRGMSLGRSVVDVREIITLAGERSWNGIEWRYLDNDRERGNGSAGPQKRQSRSIVSAPDQATIDLRNRRMNA